MVLELTNSVELARVEEKISKNGNITLKGVSKLDDELFKDLEDYAEMCKIKNSNIILGTSETKKTLLS